MKEEKTGKKINITEYLCICFKDASKGSISRRITKDKINEIIDSLMDV